MILALKRVFDYCKRLFGVWTFRTVPENYTDVTGKYEKADDDLRYLVSSFEVIEYLKTVGMEIVTADTWTANTTSRSFRDRVVNRIKKYVCMLPTMQYYGTPLFIIMKKHEQG